MQKVLDIKVTESGFDDTINKTDTLNNSLKNVENTSDDLSSSMGKSKNSILENGGAMGLLNDATGGLAMTIKDAVEATDLFGKGTKAASIAQAASNVIIGTSTGLLKALRIAIAATGVGLLVLALVALIANFEKVVDWLKNLIPGFGAVADAIGEMINFVTDLIGVTSEAERAFTKMVEAADKSLEKNKKFMDQFGDTIDDFTKRKIDAVNRYNEAIKQEGNSEQDLANLKNRLERELAAADADRIKARDKRRKEARDKEIADEKTHIDNLNKEREKAFNSEVKKLDENYKKRQAENIKSNNNNLYTEKVYLEEKLKLYKKYGKDIGDLEISIANNSVKREKEKQDFLDALAKAQAEASANEKKEQDARLQEAIDAGNDAWEERENSRIEKETELKNQRTTLYTETTAAFLEASRIFDEGTQAQMALEEVSLQIAKITADGKIETLESVSAASAAASKIAGQHTAAGKALGIASATIDTYKGIMAIWGAQSMGNPAVDVAIKTASSAIVAAQGIMSIKKILATKVPGAADSGGAGAPGGPAAPPAPSFNIVGQSSDNQLATSIATQQGQTNKSYVVSGEVTSQQELDRNRANNATFI